MLSNYILRRFGPINGDYKNEESRIKVGYAASVVGIIINVLLFSIKLFVGLLSGSIAIIADSFNNLSDASSCIITIIGFKISSMPADKEHPFGHGRVEYISALIVAFMVMIVGFQFTKSSFDRIINPSAIKFEIAPFILLLLSICFKIFLGLFNKNLGEKIDSNALKAAALDSLGDVVITSVVSLSFLLSNFTTLPIDGYIGILVALGILYSGFKLTKETLSPLIGEAPDKELVDAISNGVSSYKHVSGVHDLIIHNYGPGKCMASIHAEIPSNIDIMRIHDIIDLAERELSKKLNIILVIHMDPVCLDNEEINIARYEVSQIIKSYPVIKSMHDFRIVGDGKSKNLIFDLVVNSYEINTSTNEQSLIDKIILDIKNLHPEYNCVITIDKSFN